jgi:hypothetical protein
MPTRTEHMVTPFGGVDVSFSLQGLGGLGLQGAARFDSRDLDEVVDRMLERFPRIREDAASSIVFARGLEYIFKTVQEIEFPELRANDFIPVNTEVPAGSLSFTYSMYERTGTAKVIHGMATDMPLVSVKGKQFPAPVVTVGVAYGFTIQDVDRAARLEVPLESMLATAARWAIEYLQEVVAAVGLPNEGVVGMTNAPGVTGTTQLSTGTWLHQINAIAAATSAAPASAVAATQGLIMDVNAMKARVRNQTLGMHTINTILLPLDLFSILESIPRSPAFTDDTLLDYLEKITHCEVDFWNQLNTASTTNHGRVMAYDKTPDVLCQILPRPFTQVAPQARGLGWVVPCFSELGGVMVRRPLAMTFMDGLDDTA